jgi:hypothetical protein
MIYRVRIGREPDLLIAERLAAQLRTEGVDSLVVLVTLDERPR